MPDSTTDEPHSHGYVQYRVKIKDNTFVGTQIQNTAYIYFDFNSPIQTNTTFNQITIITSITPKHNQVALISIYPNPISNNSELKLLFDSPIDKQAIFTIYDLSGRTVFTKTIVSSKQTQSIALPNIAAGIYNCVVNSANGSSRQKLMVVRKEK